MTADLIAEGRKMLDGVTPGPWAMETVRTSCGVCHKIGPWPHKWRHGNVMSACIYDDYPSPAEGTDNMLANARFIAWSRSAVPALLAALEASQARAEVAEAELARMEADEYLHVIAFVEAHPGRLRCAARLRHGMVGEGNG